MQIPTFSKEKSSEEVYAAVVNFVSNALRPGLQLQTLKNSEALQKLGSPHLRLRCVHVGGTNGKGSVCAKVAAGLESAGTVGTFVSPHIASACERIRINGKPINRNDFINTFIQVAEVFGEDVCRMHFFEIYTMMAFNYFYNGPRGNKKKPYCDFAVIEVGIGGILDTTNIIEQPACAAVTSIGWDHMDLLGSTLESISKEKGGIFKKKCPAIIGAHGEAREWLLQCTKQVGALPILVKTAEQQNFFEMNNATAIAILDSVLGNLTDAIISEIKSTTPQLRCMVLPVEIVHSHVIATFGESSRPAGVVLDVGHNRSALRALARQLCSTFPAKKFCILSSFSRNRGVECLVEMANAFQECGVSRLHFFYSGGTHPRIRETAELLVEYENLPEETQKKFYLEKTEDSYQNSFYAAYSLAGITESVLVICGSFYIWRVGCRCLGITLDDTFDEDVPSAIP